MYAPSRSEAREFLYSAWEKYRNARALTPLEQMMVDVIAQHPEYHALLSTREGNIDADFRPDDGQLNPFLHLQLHLAIAEQLALDRPAGIRAEVDRLANRYSDRHKAMHDALECLAETIWEAQRTNTSPDTERYLECVRRK